MKAILNQHISASVNPQKVLILIEKKDKQKPKKKNQQTRKKTYFPFFRGPAPSYSDISQKTVLDAALLTVAPRIFIVMHK
jgi:hypothetical protein